MKITYATISKAMMRSNYEDAFKVIEIPEKQLWMVVVCDGMRGISSKKALFHACNK